MFVNVRVTEDPLGLFAIIGDLRWTVPSGSKIVDLPSCTPPLTKTISADGSQAVCSALTLDDVSLIYPVFGGITLPRNNSALIKPPLVTGRYVGITESRTLAGPFRLGGLFAYDVF